ncbi:hypothetical protein CMV24_06565 [Pseudomonas plecoglossicida]|uniref:Uncharacterized protein n=1 Tax=Pseudomonas plecoglossicida TaxID=70775 RepID=A0A2A3M8J5_PSEDL|nr:hypothetical protein CMV24_06565 [Pseudomonas plecoglossicida]
MWVCLGARPFSTATDPQQFKKSARRPPPGAFFSCLKENRGLHQAPPVGAGEPAKKTTRWMAPALPVFAGAPAPTGEGMGVDGWHSACMRAESDANKSP